MLKASKHETHLKTKFHKSLLSAAMLIFNIATEGGD